MKSEDEQRKSFVRLDDELTQTQTFHRQSLGFFFIRFYILFLDFFFFVVERC